MRVWVVVMRIRFWATVGILTFLADRVRVGHVSVWEAARDYQLVNGRLPHEL